jgi:hypothetical protein
MSDKIAVYIVSMGETPEAVRAFIASFSARFKIPPERMLALSRSLPARIGSYDLEKARRFGLEIKRMGGQVSLRQPASQEPAPSGAPAHDDGPAASWVVHGQAESQDELKSMTSSGAGAPDNRPGSYDYPAGLYDDVARPVAAPAPKRQIAGKYEAKQVYTTDQSFGLSEEGFKKVKDLYAGRKNKKPIVGSPAFRAALLLSALAAVLILYLYRHEIQTITFGLKKVAISDAYETRLPANVSVPADLTGSYTGAFKYKTSEGDVALVQVTLFVEGKNIHDVVAEVTSSSSDIGDYHLKVEYAPGYLKYSRTVNNKPVYEVENTFPSSSNAVTRVDDKGKFSIEIGALDAGVDPNTIPESEKDNVGAMIFLKMEGAFAGNDRFYGGFLTSGSPLVGWEARKQQ